MTNLTPESIQEVIEKLQAIIAPKSTPVDPTPPVIRWIPVCDALYKEKGDGWIRGYKREPHPVLLWLKVLIDPSASNPVAILSVEKP